MAAALAVLAGACAARPAGPFPGAPVAVRVPQDQALDAIVWSADRPLTWADFRATPEGDADVAAVTTYALTWESNCTPDGFSFRVSAVFLPDQSWVKPEVVARPERSQLTLAHEQAHFDISEIQARKMRRELSRLASPCRLTEEELAAALGPLVVEDSELQRRYDQETTHGLDLPQQSRWESEVMRDLESLERYADLRLTASGTMIKESERE